MSDTKMREVKALSDTDLVAALVQVKQVLPMLGQALADHIGARAQERERLEREHRQLREAYEEMSHAARYLRDKAERLERELADEWRRSEIEARKLGEVQGELMRLQMRVIEPLPPHERGPRPFGSAMELLERSKTMDEPEGKP